MTYFVKIVDNVAQMGVYHQDNIKQLFPELANVIIFLPEMVEPLGYGIFEFSEKPNPGRYKKVVEIAPQRNEMGQWVQTWSVIPATDEECAQQDLGMAIGMRNERSYKLSITDWTQLEDSQLTLEQKQAWALYRQQLRDITDQEGFPWDIIWPEKPTFE